MDHTLTGVLFAFFALICLFFYFQFNEAASLEDNLLVEVPDEWRKCRVDSDCINVGSSCCSCFAGDRGAAINIKYFSAWEKKLFRFCRKAKCATPDCTRGQVVCQDKMCSPRSL